MKTGRSLFGWLLALLLPLHVVGMPMVGDTLPSRGIPPLLWTHPAEAVVVPVALSVAMGGALYGQDHQLKALRDECMGPMWRHHFDDYLQFAPLALTWGLGVSGVPMASGSLGRAFVSQAAVYGVTGALVYLSKRAVGRLRPDGSAYNSFPSGHTATAFASAAILDAEYGERYPWLSTLGYASAVVTGVARSLNNRHWATDIAVGASVGLITAYAGYRLGDWLWGDPRGTRRSKGLPDVDSPFIALAIESGRSTLSGVSAVAVGAAARIGVLRHWGLLLSGTLAHGAPSVSSYAVGVTYARSLLSPRLLFDGEGAVACVGTTWGARVGAGATWLLRPHFGVRASTRHYFVLPYRGGEYMLGATSFY